MRGIVVLGGEGVVGTLLLFTMLRGGRSVGGVAGDEVLVQHSPKVGWIS